MRKWRIEEQKVPGYSRRLYLVDEEGNTVADIIGAGSLNPKVLAEVQATADLLASTPVLLAALRDCEKRLVAIEANARYGTSVGDHDVDLKVGLSADVRWRIVAQVVDTINEARAAIAIAADSRAAKAGQP